MKKSTIIVTAIFLIAISLGGATVRAQDTSSKDPYAGDIWSRSTLTGDWGGFRNEWAQKGVTIDLNVTQIGQGVVNGGKSGAWQYGGRGDLTINLDSQKLGLWPGGFFNLELEGNWAPFLSPYFGLTLGKFATITNTSGDMNEFAHGKGATQFMNMALNFNPLLAFTVPYSTLGIGTIVLPTKDPKEAIASFLVMSANGNPTTSGFEDLNGNAIVVAGEGRVRTDFFGLTGHQLFGTTFSNKKFTSIDQRLDRDVIENQT